MPDQVKVTIDGETVPVAAGTSVAAAILNAGGTGFRISAGGEIRGPACGMGICYECRVTIDGRPHQRSCMLLCAEGMVVETDV